MTPSVPSSAFITNSTAIFLIITHAIQNLFAAFLTVFGLADPYVAIGISVAIVVLFLRVPLVSELVVLPYRAVTKFFIFLGWVHVHERWCVVYDSITKEPIDPAYVIVRDMQGKEIASMLTDLDGRFALLLPKGIYRIEVQKTNYAFPSYRLAAEKTDGYYSNLYFGETITVIADEEIITFAIPLDPVAKDWNQKEKRRRGLFLRPGKLYEYRSAQRAYFVIGAVFVISRFVLLTDRFSYHMLLAYLLFIVAGVLRVLINPSHFRQSVVVEHRTRKPVSFARVRIFNESDSEVARKITSINGQFLCLLSRGSYYVTIEIRDQQNVYQKVFTSNRIAVTGGYLAEKFEI